MSNPILRAPRRDRPIIMDPRAVAHNNLSWAARGLLCYLLSRPTACKLLINDLRKEFDAPKAPFSIATVGFGGANLPSNWHGVLNAQMAVSDGKKHPDFAGNVATCDTRPFWRGIEVSPKDEGHHYNRNAETYLLVGDALARNMIKMKSRKD